MCPRIIATRIFGRAYKGAAYPKATLLTVLPSQPFRQRNSAVGIVQCQAGPNREPTNTDSLNRTCEFGRGRKQQFIIIAGR